MALVDDRVLEYINEHDTGAPKKMKEDGPIRYSRGYIARRCKKLAEKGLLKPVGNGVYMITDEGVAYLEGRLDTGTWTFVDEEGEETESMGEPTGP